MPGYAIHLAVGKIYAKNNKIINLEEFKKGIIAPDLQKDKKKSHYGPASSNPGLVEFIQEKGITTSYNEGYFLHLLTDYLFYHKFLTIWDTSIYEDYNKLNSNIIKKYEIEIPKEIKKVIKFKEGKTTILNEEKLYHFIDYVGKINIRQMLLQENNRLANIQDNTK